VDGVSGLQGATMEACPSRRESGCFCQPYVYRHPSGCTGRGRGAAASRKVWRVGILWPGPSISWQKTSYRQSTSGRNTRRAPSEGEGVEGKVPRYTGGERADESKEHPHYAAQREAEVGSEKTRECDVAGSKALVKSLSSLAQPRRRPLDKVMHAEER
jgi:hypothetical protein